MLPNFDELTLRPILSKDQLQDKEYYVGRCRNASVARWNAQRDCFVHWREKFGTFYLEEICHPVDEQQFDVFRVIEQMPPGTVKYEIPFDLNSEFKGQLADLTEHDEKVWCSCHLKRNVCILHPNRTQKYLLDKRIEV